MIAPALAVAWGACSDPAARVRVVALGGDCARPAGANAAKVTAYAAGGEAIKSLSLDEAVAIGDFPADTEQIGIEVLVGGGAIGAQGKSAPLVFEALADGAAIPILMAPPGGFCELPGMLEARAQPLVARAGDGALVVGGTGDTGPLSSAEYYDPTTATFRPIAVPRVLTDGQGFTGAALATLPDGRVALIGGHQRAAIVFDPKKLAFVTDPTLVNPAAFHAAIATGDHEVLIAGGCMEVTGLACDGGPRLQSLRYDLTRLSSPEASATLAPGLRVSAQLFDLGIQLDGRRQFLLAGGSGAPGRADRFALDDTAAEVVAGGHARAAALDGGAVLTAFADDTVAGDGAAAVIAPGAAAAQRISGAPPLQGVRLIALEDGRVVGFGGDPDGRVVTYDPTHDAWTASLPTPTGRLTAPSLVRLTDGTVLVVGGAVTRRAWLYRPSLVGPASGSVTAIPANDATNDATRGVLTAPDPATVTRVPSPAAWRLTTPAGAPAGAPAGPAGAAMARALVGGPRLAVGSVLATVHVTAGGVALIAQQTGPGHAIIARLAPGMPPQLVRLDAGTEQAVCSGAAVLGAFDPAQPVTLRLAIIDGTARLTRDGSELLRCPLAAADRGAWGIASLGAGAAVTVDTITVARGRPAA